jgi:hypothetical protein
MYSQIFLVEEVFRPKLAQKGASLHHAMLFFFSIRWVYPSLPLLGYTPDMESTLNFK